MLSYLQVPIALELINLGATLECLVEFAGCSRQIAKQLINTAGPEQVNHRDRYRLGVQFLATSNNTIEAAKFLFFWHNRIHTPSEERVSEFLSAYRNYLLITREPLSINACAGIVTRLAEGRYQISTCEKTGVNYISDRVHGIGPWEKAFKKPHFKEMEADKC